MSVHRMQSFTAKAGLHDWRVIIHCAGNVCAQV